MAKRSIASSGKPSALLMPIGDSGPCRCNRSLANRDASSCPRVQPRLLERFHVYDVSQVAWLVPHPLSWYCRHLLDRRYENQLPPGGWRWLRVGRDGLHTVAGLFVCPPLFCNDRGPRGDRHGPRPDWGTVRWSDYSSGLREAEESPREKDRHQACPSRTEGMRLPQVQNREIKTKEAWRSPRP
jgi:hypothetical protein